MEKEDSERSAERTSHCCVSFSDASPDLERVLARSGNHCCVTFKSSKSVDARRQSAKYGVIAIVVIFGMAVVATIIISSPHRGPNQVIVD
jgi:hypothetical protein